MFLSSDWLRVWIETLAPPGSRPLLIEVRVDDRLVGAFPLLRRGGTIRRLDVLGGGAACPDHLAPIGEPDWEATIATAIAETIAADPDVDIVLLDGLASGTHFTRAITTVAERHGGQVSTTTCPYIELPESFDDFLSRRSRKSAAKFRRGRRIIEQAGGQFDTVSVMDEVEATMRELVRLHLATRAPSGRRTTFSDAAMQEFLISVACRLHDRGRLRLHRLTADGRVIAAICCFDTPDGVQYYCSGYDPDWSTLSPGDHILGFAIEQAIASSARTFDLLRGDEPYKFRLTNAANDDVRIEFARSLRGRMFLSSRRSARQLRALRKRT